MPAPRHTRDLFGDAPADTRHERLADGAWLLHGFALARADALLTAIEHVAAVAVYVVPVPLGLTKASAYSSNASQFRFSASAS